MHASVHSLFNTISGIFNMALIMNKILFTLNIQQDKPEQTVSTQIRLIQREPSGLGLHYLVYMSTCIITISTTHKIVKWIHLKKKKIKIVMTSY